MKYRHETNIEDITFLDLKINLLDAKISVDFFVKSIDHHQFLQYTSSHP